MIINIKGYRVLIDDEDYELVKNFKWSVDNRPKYNAVYFKCYAGGGRKNAKHIYLHRLIAGARMPLEGQNIKNNSVDHANHNTLDNRKCNLRICTHAENMRNRKKRRGRTLPKGVKKQQNGYSARICANKKEVHLGCFKTIEEAKAAYDNAARRLYGEYFYFEKGA